MQSVIAIVAGYLVFGISSAILLMRQDLGFAAVGLAIGTLLAAG